MTAMSGPLPPSHEFASYEKTLPGAADRILRMAEEAQKAVDILASHGEQASVIGRVTDSEGVVIR